MIALGLVPLACLDDLGVVITLVDLEGVAFLGDLAAATFLGDLVAFLGDFAALVILVTFLGDLAAVLFALGVFFFGDLDFFSAATVFLAAAFLGAVT